MLTRPLRSVSSACPFRARPCIRVVRLASRPPFGVLTNSPTTGGQSFQKLHKEVLQDSEWYGPEAADHAVSPAAAAAAPAAAATREDVRLITSFTKYLTKHKVELSVLFCSEAVLSADSRAVCDPQAAHQLELLTEFLTSGCLRVGEELPHWFVNGNLRGAIKCWMATRPAAAALTATATATNAVQGAVAAAQQELVRERVASVSEHQLLGLVASPLVDALLAAMPEWTHGSVWELAGWEPAEGVQATAEDVALLHCFGTLVYASRLDVAVFLRQLCGADPFSWTMAQVAQGVVPEPEPWLLERFFMSKHTVGEPLPLWFAKWGVREEIIQWLQGEQAARFVQNLLETRGLGGAASMTAVTSVPSAATVNDLSAALDLLEGSVGSLMASALLRQGLAATPEATPATCVTCRRDVRVYDKADPSGAPYSIDLLATCNGSGNAAGTDQEGLMAALVAVAVQLPYGGGAAGDVTVTVRQAKERLDWLAFLLRNEGGLRIQSAVTKVLLLLPPQPLPQQQQQQQQPGEQGSVAILPRSVEEYLEQGDVLVLGTADLPYKAASA